MADREWLRHLAEASYTGGQWRLKDPAEVRRLAAARIEDAVNGLYELALEACEILNEYARGKRVARALPMAPRDEEGIGRVAGFMLLMGKCQINVELRKGGLDVTLVTVEGFTRKPRRLYRLSAHADTFGSVVWSADNALLMTDELIMKRLLEDLTRAAEEPAR